MILLQRYYDILKSLITIGFIWIGPSILLYLLSYTKFGEMFSAQWLSFALIVFFVFLLSTIMANFFRFEKKFLRHNNVLRRNLIFIFTIMRIVLFQIENGETFVGVFAGILGTTTLIAISCLVGSYLVQAINRLPELIPVCSVAFTVDLYSVLRGPSKEIALQIGEFYSNGTQGPVPFVDIILVKIPNPSVEYLVPVFGISDWIFITFFTAVMLKFQIADSTTGRNIKDVVDTCKMHMYFPFVSCALLVSILAAYLFNAFVPALPIIITIVLPWLIAKNWALFNLKKTDWYLTLLPLILAIVIFLF